MTKPLRIAIVGAGNIAHVHGRAYAAQPPGRCELVGCADVDLARAESLTCEFGGHACRDVARMLDELQPDAVSVCTPPIYHTEHATLALERGIAVLCEKPLAADGASARALAGRSSERGVLLMPAHCHRFHGPVRLLKELLEAGKFGRLLHFQNRFAFEWAGVENTWFSRRAVAGGGILLDTTVHSVDLFRHLAGEVTWVAAQLSHTVTTEVEDSAAILLRSVDGALGQISCSWVSPPGESTIRVYGSAGTALLDYADEGVLRYATSGVAGWSEMRDPGPDRFASEASHFLDCLATGTAPLITPEDGARAIEIIDAAYRSAATGAGVAI